MPRQLFGIGARAFAAAGVLAVAGLTQSAFGQTAATPAAAPKAEAPAADGGYARVVESDQGETLELQISARTMVPPGGKGPAVKLVGVTHIGDKAYYEALQKYLDAQDLVLYEGVKPAGSAGGEDKAESEADRVKKTERRLRLLAILTERYRRDHKDIPDSVDQLIEGLGGPARKIAKSALSDAWGHAIAYEPGVKTEASGDKPAPRRTFDWVSLGADGVAGGEGDNKDIRFSAQSPLSKEERTGGGGMQENLASSLGLQFQLTAIDYDRPKWRNSDMSFDQIQKDLADLNASGDMLFKMLDGSSFSAKILNVVLAVVRSSPAMAANATVMLMEVLSVADTLLDRGGPGGEQNGALMKVIIQHRNDAVLADFKAAIAEKPELGSVALFYGAGHLPDLRGKLEAMGYTLDASKDQWFSAIRVNAKESGISAQQIASMRQMIRGSLAQMAPKAEKPAAGAKSE